MRSTLKSLLGALLLAVAAGPALAQEADPLDQKFGVPSQPAYIKHYEANKEGKVILNPYLQVATPEFPAILDPKMAPYNWTIDMQGRVSIIPEAAHPLGRTYEKGFFRPEDQSQRKPGTRENFGHVSSLGGAPGRISGELLYDKDQKVFTINNKSGRYSKHNSDRTPEQLVNAATLIRQVVDPGPASWGQVAYLLEYAPQSVREKLMEDPKLQYDDAKKKSRPHIVVMPGAPSAFATAKAAEAAVAKSDTPEKVAEVAKPAEKAADKPAASAPAPKKAKKSKAANNDDPS